MAEGDRPNVRGGWEADIAACRQTAADACSGMVSTPRYEDRWGSAGAVTFRLTIPIGLLSSVALLAPLIWTGHFWVVAAYPLIIAGLVWLTVRGVVLASGGWKVVSLLANAAITITAAVLAFGIWISSGGI